MWAWYNEIDPYAAQWLRNLIANKLITDGEVDERPVQDVKPCELGPFTRCHFFAGIAGWDLAFRLADFPTDQKVWTGSCPCQPFSTAGKRLQFDDERHLWPFWHYLISVCRPPIIFGEQVANGAGVWLDLVYADLESQGYAVGAALLPAAGVGAPHIRNRNWFVADSDQAGWTNPPGISAPQARTDLRATAGLGDRAAPVADTQCVELRQQSGRGSGANGTSALFASEYGAQRLAADSHREGEHAGPLDAEMAEVPRPSFWSVESSLDCVAHGIPRAMEQLRAYGNAIVPQAAAEFIKAYLDCRP